MSKQVWTKAGQELLKRWFPNGRPRQYQGSTEAEHPVWTGLVGSIRAIEAESRAALLELAEQYHSGHSVAGKACRCVQCRELSRLRALAQSQPAPSQDS